MPKEFNRLPDELSVPRPPVDLPTCRLVLEDLGWREFEKTWVPLFLDSLLFHEANVKDIGAYLQDVRKRYKGKKR